MLPTDLPRGASVVFHSSSRGPCDERAFVLTAVGIAAAIGFDGAQFVLEVADIDATRALMHLKQYEHERQQKPLPLPPIPSLPNAWVGCAIYAVVLIAIGLLISNGFWRLDAFDAGEIDAGRVQRGQWWRAWTALTLHVDGEHLIANMTAGVWFGYLAARQIGSGIAWLLIVTGAAVANLLEALLAPPSHSSVGASTAVFTALGLLAAHSWRLRATAIQRWALRWAPLVGGVVLLGWFGTGSGDDSEAAPSADIVAHAGGFLIGVLLGAMAAQAWAKRVLHRIPQWLAGLMALGSIVIAWVYALRS